MSSNREHTGMNSPAPRFITACGRRPGFTLIELLVTMSIIAVLVSIAIPVTNRVLHGARAAQCTGHLRSLGNALHLYLADNNNVMPTLVIARESKESEEDAIDNTLDKYVDDQGVFRCPADNKHFFEHTGTSYMWNNLLNGQPVPQLSMMGIIRDGSRIPVIYDKENFHKYRDVEVNILYADGHVAREIQFVVDE
jgi:prepilin-type N-terminal cleavage/methylation domain-containing protein/prepilin-type processing-associated H-X9-DG protein